MVPDTASAGVAFRAVDRIPDSPDLVVRVRPWRYAAIIAGVSAVLPVVVLIAPLTVLVVLMVRDHQIIWSFALFYALIVLLLTGIVLLGAARLTRRAMRYGPIFAADGTGLWLPAVERVRRRRRVQLCPRLFVPWESVVRITPGRVLVSRVIRVKIRDPRIVPGPAMPSWIEPEARPLLFETGLAVPACYEFGVDRRSVLDRLRELSDGRTSVS